MSVRVEFEGLEKALIMMERLEKIREKLGYRVLYKESKELERLVKFFCPVFEGYLSDESRRGALKRSIRRRRISNNRVVIEVGGLTAPYARIVEHGARAHRIPRSGYKFMMFMKGDEWIIAKRVWHPGYPGRHFVQKALEVFVERMYKIYREEIDAAISYSTR